MAKPKNVPLPPSFSKSSVSVEGIEDIDLFRLEGYEPRKRKATGNSPLEKAMNLGGREHLHALIARIFYSGGLPFHLAGNSYFVAAFQYAAENHIPWRAPQYKEMETKMWDVSGDAFDSIEGAGVLEVANLSLDEHNMEVVLFRDEIDENEDS
ncbi:hypothetical protein Acr_01g0003150 [Actinidia rufa]|uniref:Uncharacterized protein n=1 Tax=Actinidia rufa TaxID=165716 RepID=A0A7J0E304_9ERIC|nr:hypothetical protein Acr_01g0003150 [Actinidia rufa]